MFETWDAPAGSRQGDDGLAPKMLSPMPHVTEITLVHRWNRTSGIKNWGWEWQPSAVSDPVKDY